MDSQKQNKNDEGVVGWFSQKKKKGSPNQKIADKQKTDNLQKKKQSDAPWVSQELEPERM